MQRNFSTITDVFHVAYFYKVAQKWHIFRTP